jgi:ATP-dependent phosphofructokinase / diphosphate-dependent phosphofructokinase
MKRVGILNSGGDCAGLNAVIASAVKTGIPLGYELIGFEKGWEGVLSPMHFRTLTSDDVRGISYLGGTILGTVNHGRFGAKKGAGDVRKIPDEILQEAASNLRSQDIDGLIVIGGDGTLSGALQLSEFGVNIVGVPKTIDNDLMATSRTFGFSTAAQVVVDALDRIHTTASSHGRVIVVETMGRHTGWIAIRAGLAGGAHAILIPEFDFKMEDLVQFLRDRQARGKASVVVVAEGSHIDSKRQQLDAKAEQEHRLGGISVEMMSEIERLAPGEFEMRNTVLGHVQRGGTPNAADRVVAKAYGCEAMKAYDRGEFGVVIAYTLAGMSTVPIKSCTGELRQVTAETMEYITATDLGIFVH